MGKEKVIRSKFAGTNTIVCCDGGFKGNSAAAGYVRINNQYKIYDGHKVKEYHPDDNDKRRGSVAAELIAAAIALEEAPKGKDIDFFSDSEAVIDFINNRSIPKALQNDSQFESIYWRFRQAIKNQESVTATHRKHADQSIKDLLEECHDLAADAIGVRAKFTDNTKNRATKAKAANKRSWPPKVGSYALEDWQP